MSKRASSGICPSCSLPIELCACQSVSKEETRIRVRTEKRKFGRIMTLVEFQNVGDVDLRKITKKLKSKAACGGTLSEGNIVELQGDHRFQIKGYLKELGFDENNVQIQK